VLFKYWQTQEVLIGADYAWSRDYRGDAESVDAGFFSRVSCAKKIEINTTDQYQYVIRPVLSKAFFVWAIYSVVETIATRLCIALLVCLLSVIQCCTGRCSILVIVNRLFDDLG